MNLGAFLRSRRESAGLSLRAVADSVEVDPAYLSRVERGLVPASEALLKALGQTLELDSRTLQVLSGRFPHRWEKAFTKAPERATDIVERALSQFDDDLSSPSHRGIMTFSGTRVIETDDFPFEHLSDIAEAESWRKEINRPIYHLHKWWAQRLGSVFRALVLGAFSPKGTNLMEAFYQPTRIPGAMVFDPFMGSGTTVGEALKLGARAVGRDINPVAHYAVTNALRSHPERELRTQFSSVMADVRSEMLRHYRCVVDGDEATARYFFWVKYLPCPRCDRRVDLFNSYVFSRHAYAKRHPEAKVLCPNCGGINDRRYDVGNTACDHCDESFNAKVGPARRTRAECPACGHDFPIAKTAKAQGRPPAERLYAKITLDPAGGRVYSRADEVDQNVYQEAVEALSGQVDLFPNVAIEPGYNTNQVLNYGYSHWHQMFNARQLLVLGTLGKRIAMIEESSIRNLLLCAFSGLLEFNNMFTSFKGEGTGAVRHMFSHHILKPERQPFETNPLAESGSGNFPGIFKRRVIRLMEYASEPFELATRRVEGRVRSEKVAGMSLPIGHQAAASWNEFSDNGKDLYLSVGDSSDTDLPDGTVDAIVTDPPFFDNVHYSQLADFFWVWQRHLVDDPTSSSHSTRSGSEVQHESEEEFSRRLGGVWRECRRVLAADGLLIFTYHHSRKEGWRALLEALAAGDFGVVACHPVKSELSVASPKHQAKSPIDLDIVVVCRKREQTTQETLTDPEEVIRRAGDVARDQVRRFNLTGRHLGENDVLITLTAQVMRHLSWHCELQSSVRVLNELDSAVQAETKAIYEAQEIADPEPAAEQLVFV